ncbi:MAG: hypothetical protein HY670_05415, partial [Chloroflexi bacterium]|nr:hypothetical protein [Chloroflexota bacterium]
MEILKKRRGLITAGGLIALAAALAVIAIALISRQTIFSPGKLNTQASGEPVGGVLAHADLSGQCSACHAPPLSSETMAQRCLSCHTNVKDELENPHELHRRLLPVDEPPTCVASCHTEHKGPNAPLSLVTEKHFTREELGYSLEGHGKKDDGSPIACVDCHPDTLDKFEVSTCNSCHQEREPEFTQPHVDSFGPKCLECHDGKDTYGKAFDHNLMSFPLQGKHTSPACSDCHERARTIPELKAAPQSCNSCHEKDDKHKGTGGQECQTCHTDNGWKEVTYDHELANFTLVGKKATTACSSCHAENKFNSAPTTCNACHQKDDKHEGSGGQACETCHVEEDWKEVTYDHELANFTLVGKKASTTCFTCHAENKFNDTPTSCNACHEKDDKHEGTAGQDCATCHVEKGWREFSYDHGLTKYPLTGGHIGAACSTCHAGNKFDNTPRDCYSCHEKDDAHKGSGGQDCASCHSTANWKEGWKLATFDHDLTKYPLEGKHAGQTCTSCHADNRFKDTPTSCTACHQKDDKHEGTGGQACVTCHVEKDWKMVSYNHELTGYPLTGKHTTPACASCHTDNKFSDTPTTCNACHQKDDKHQGSGGQGCATCHNENGWKLVTYDHNLTKYPLTGKHTAAACASCHTNVSFNNTPQSCNSCHQKDDRHKGTFGQDCARCHSTTGWPGATMDHAIIGAPLMGTHANLPCSSCHGANVPIGSMQNCAACHQSKDVHLGTLGRGCASCHNSTDWKQATVDHSLTAFPLTGKHTGQA